jgi:glycosyltransferase involved in cell wall biosynthesis
MKIIFCLHHFLPEFIGGTEIYTLYLAKQLILQNEDPVVIVPGFGATETREYFYERVRVIRYAETSHGDRRMILGLKKPEGLNEFVRLIKNEKPDIVHFHEIAPGAGISIFHVEKVAELDIPIIITFHVPYYSCFRGSLLYKGKEKCDGEIDIKKCTECIYNLKNINGFKASVLSGTAMALFKLNIDTTMLNTHLGTALGFPFVIARIKKNLLRLSNYAEKIVVIADWYRLVLERNQVPADKLVFIKQGLTNKKINSNRAASISYPLRLVYLGRISSLKGTRILIQALLELDSDKIYLDIYGAETEEKFALDLREKTRHSPNINWKGRISSTHVITVLSQYDLLCLPSAFEMSPLVIQEAFAAGIPVLASDVYGNAEQIKDGVNGWLFKFNDAEDLCNKLKLLVADPSLIANAKKHLPELNTFEKVADDHLKLYDSIIQNYKKH